jgi:nitrate reductase cytochrome c-type subunit
MRILAAALALVLLVSPVYAQNAGGMGGMGGKGGGKRAAQNSDQQKVDQKKQKAAEDAYKAGLKMIPDAKEKYDPWKNAR